jgi:hypothetical protein
MIFVRQLHEQVRSLAQVNRYVVVDTVLAFDDAQEDLLDFQKAMEGIEVFKVLVYCSPFFHVQHLIDRNNSGLYADKRPVVATAKEFCMIYTPAARSSLAVDTFKMQEIDSAVDVVQTYLRESGMSEEMVQKEISDLKETYVAGLFSKDQNVVSVAPRFVHDMMVNTGKLSSWQCAQLIYDQLQDRDAIL